MIVNDSSVIYLLLRRFNVDFGFGFFIKTFVLNYRRFRGGKEDWWKSDTNGYIYYDNLLVRQIST